MVPHLDRRRDQHPDPHPNLHRHPYRNPQTHSFLHTPRILLHCHLECAKVTVTGTPTVPKVSFVSTRPTVSQRTFPVAKEPIPQARISVSISSTVQVPTAVFSTAPFANLSFLANDPRFEAPGVVFWGPCKDETCRDFDTCHSISKQPTQFFSNGNVTALHIR